MSQVGLAVSAQFLEQLQKMPAKVNKKVLAFVDRFRENPDAAGNNLESLNQAKDDRVRSVRFGDDYRGILVKPKSGNEYLMVYVDHHDEAYRWVENKTFDVHPHLGALQIFDVQEAAQAVDTAKETRVAAEDYAGSFAHLSDDELVRLGLPKPLLPAIREVASEPEFDLLAPHLPEEARDPLRWVVLGGAIGEAKELYEQEAKPPEDVEDFSSALQQQDSARRFVRVRSASQIEDLLAGPLAKWRVFLHPNQQRIVHPKNEYKGPVRVLGGAGTGKTVVAMHRAKVIADSLADSGSKVLFTTFSRSLALDIAHNLKSLCGGQDPKRIEVVHLHSWAAGYVRGLGIDFKIANADDVERLWDEEVFPFVDDLKFSEAFCKEEWAYVIQAQDVADEATYLRASRKGRGGPRLRKQDREALWKVFVRYRHALETAGKMEFTDLVRQARMHLEKHQGTLSYAAVIADEVQDFSAEDLKLLRAMVPPGEHDLFLVGDAHQRIYGRPVTLSSCRIDIRGRGKRLRVNYRTTHEIRQYAVALLQGVEVDDLDGSADDLKGYTSLLSGPEPTVVWFDHAEQERDAVVAAVVKLINDGAEPGTICVVAPTNNLLDQTYKSALDAEGVAVVRIKGQDTVPSGNGVRLCTMHRAKGLEFPHVLVAGLGAARFPHPIQPELSDDPRALKQHEDQARRLAFVAVTRARDSVHVSGWGKRAVV